SLLWQLPAACPDRHSFPTRRSSDLGMARSPPMALNSRNMLITTQTAKVPSHNARDLPLACWALPRLTAKPVSNSPPMISMIQLMLMCYPCADEKSVRSEEHTSELQSRENLVCRLLLEKKKNSN